MLVLSNHNREIILVHYQGSLEMVQFLETHCCSCSGISVFWGGLLVSSLPSSRFSPFIYHCNVQQRSTQQHSFARRIPRVSLSDAATAEISR